MPSGTKSLPSIPLAERMRPQSLDELAGQTHLIGNGKPIAQMVQKGTLFSMILWGPPGSGKTSLARVVSEQVKGHFVQLSAVSAGVRDVRAVIAAAGRPNTITADMVKEGAVVIDVGVNRVDDATRERGYRLVGDVDFEGVSEKASMITPVPGGVGPMTITMLLHNTVESARRTVR